MSETRLQGGIRRSWRVILNKSPRIGMYTYRKFCRYSPLKTDADPFKRLWVDPSKITKNIDRCDYANMWGVVEGGNWDINTTAFKDESPNPAIAEWFNTNDDTVLRAELTKAPGTTANPRYGNGGIEERIEEIKSLKRSLEKYGYMSQQELIDLDNRHRLASNDPVPSELNEIIVDIGRNGEFIFRRCGQHRLFLSKLLKLDSVCVLIGRRHTWWQKKRNSIRDSNGSAEPPSSLSDFLNHPDLRDLFNR